MAKLPACVNLGIGLTRENKRLLLVEAEPHGSLRVSLGAANPDKPPVTLSTITGVAVKVVTLITLHLGRWERCCLHFRQNLFLSKTVCSNAKRQFTVSIVTGILCLIIRMECHCLFFTKMRFHGHIALTELYVCTKCFVFNCTTYKPEYYAETVLPKANATSFAPLVFCPSYHLRSVRYQKK